MKKSKISELNSTYVPIIDGLGLLYYTLKYIIIHSNTFLYIKIECYASYILACMKYINMKQI